MSTFGWEASVTGFAGENAGSDQDEPRVRLLQLHDALTTELATTQAALVEIRQLRADRSDDDEHDPEGTPLSAEWSRLAGLHRVAEQRVADADAAIANFDAGRYGSCLDCGQPISPGRLEALSTATRCVRCAGRAAGRR